MTRTLTETKQTTRTLTVAKQGRHRSPLKARASQLAVILACILAWQLFSLSELALLADMPGPLAAIGAWGTLILSVDYWAAVGHTVLSWVIGVTLSAFIGIGLGVLIGSYQALTRSTRLLIDFIRTIPAVAVIPLLLLLAGASRTMIVTVVILAAIWPLMVQTISGVTQLETAYTQVARSFRLSLRDRLRFIIAPELLAFVWPALRIAATLSLLVILTAEMFSGAPGIGAEVTHAMNSLRNDVLFAYILTAGILGMVINAVLMETQRRLFKWHPSIREAVA